MLSFQRYVSMEIISRFLLISALDQASVIYFFQLLVSSKKINLVYVPFRSK